MKLLILLAASLCYINGAPAISIESTVIDIEFRGYMIELEIAIIAQASNVSRIVQDRANSYYKAYGRLRDEVSTLLFALGPTGLGIGLKINTEASSIIISLMNEFSDFKLFTNVLANVTTIREKFVKILQSEIKILEDAVDKKPKAAKCWDENKGAMRKVVTNALNSSRLTVDGNLVQLDKKIQSLAKKVGDGVNRIKNEVLVSCRVTPLCVLKYFEDNYPTISKEFLGYRDNAILLVDETLSQVFKDLDVVFKKAADEYLVGRKTIETCIEKA